MISKGMVEAELKGCSALAAYGFGLSPIVRYLESLSVEFVSVHGAQSKLLVTRSIYLNCSLSCKLRDGGKVHNWLRLI